MPQSTPLDTLDSTEPTADEERVRRILSEMNAGPEGRVISEPPVSTSTGELRMDPVAARANIIGNSTPSMADFQSMLFQTSPGMTPIHRTEQEQPAPPRKETKAPPPSLWNTFMQYVRAPLVVTLIVFLLNLPVITSIMSRYASWMYLGSGEISISGLIVKSLLGGGLFAAYQVISSLFDKN
jgi:hypothetical protein